MLRHTFREIVIDDIRYFVLPDMPLETLDNLEVISLRQVGFNSAIYAITEETMQEILADENEQQ